MNGQKTIELHLDLPDWSEEDQLDLERTLRRIDGATLRDGNPSDRHMGDDGFLMLIFAGVTVQVVGELVVAAGRVGKDVVVRWRDRTTRIDGESDPDEVTKEIADDDEET